MDEMILNGNYVNLLREVYRSCYPDSALEELRKHLNADTRKKLARLIQASIRTRIPAACGDAYLAKLKKAEMRNDIFFAFHGLDGKSWTQPQIRKHYGLEAGVLMPFIYKNYNLWRYPNYHRKLENRLRRWGLMPEYFRLQDWSKNVHSHLALDSALEEKLVLRLSATIADFILEYSSDDTALLLEVRDNLPPEEARAFYNEYSDNWQGLVGVALASLKVAPQLNGLKYIDAMLR